MQGQNGAIDTNNKKQSASHLGDTCIKLYLIGDNCFENTPMGDKPLTSAVDSNNTKIL